MNHVHRGGAGNGLATLVRSEAFAAASHELEQRRREVIRTLKAIWAPPQIHSFEPDFEQIVAGEERPRVVEDPAPFPSGSVPTGGGTVEPCVFLGQFDKRYPIVLTLAVTALPLR